MKFEELDVWKRSARLSAEIYKNLRSLKDYGFKDQITGQVCRFRAILPKVLSGNH